MNLLDIERDRLRKHYLELDDRYDVLKGETREILMELTKTELGIIEKFEPFVDLYTKINCKPEFYKEDLPASDKVKLNMHDLKETSKRVVSISNHISEHDLRQYPAISLLGIESLLSKADELGIGNGVKIKDTVLAEFKNYLEYITGEVLEREVGDSKLKVNLQEDEKIMDFEKRIHAADSELKGLIRDMTEIKEVCTKYNEKLKYLDEIYSNYREILREYVDFTDINNWKVLDENQDALMAIHSTAILAQLLHDMCSTGIIDRDGKVVSCKAFDEMIKKADEVIDVIEVYIQVNVF